MTGGDMEFPEYLVQWAGEHSLTDREAAALLQVPLETFRAWKYRKQRCPYERPFRMLMGLLPRSKAGRDALAAIKSGRAPYTGEE
jgi:hypothetical protein